MKTIAAAAVNIVIFGVVAALHTAILSFITTRVDLGLMILLSAIITYVFWKLTKPVRSLSSMVNANSAHEGMGSMDLNPWNKAMKLWSLANGTMQAHQARGLRRDLRGAGGDERSDETDPAPAPPRDRVVDPPHPGPRYVPPLALPAGTGRTNAEERWEVVPDETPIVVHPTPQQREVVPEDPPIVVHPTPQQREVVPDEPDLARERDRQDAIQRADNSAERETMRQLGRDLREGVRSTSTAQGATGTATSGPVVTGELVDTTPPGLVHMEQRSDHTYFHPPTTTQHVTRIQHEMFVPPTDTERWVQTGHAADTEHTVTEEGRTR